MDIIEAQSPVSMESAGQMFEFLLYASDYPVKENGSVLSIPKLFMIGAKHFEIRSSMVQTRRPVAFFCVAGLERDAMQLQAQWSSSPNLVGHYSKLLESKRSALMEKTVSVGSKEGWEANAQTEEKISSDAKITVKITIRKSNNKILFAEAEEDFVDFLFSILALPLGSVVKFLERTPNLGCISTLYKSVESSEFDRFITSSCHKETLLSPIIAPRLGSKN
ncbi:hypothetical protein GIB67_042324 [Kingdonia uniflora]|uniref:Uncharacterized protein n=1 Tax=Kingdonia uniflora TaxID=39325 RepID=A0A7J7LE10_9MAGN|nr:hypothetical protein GIB67_042324 [Kingdonia uniflora]